MQAQARAGQTRGRAHSTRVGAGTAACAQNEVPAHQRSARAARGEVTSSSEPPATPMYDVSHFPTLPCFRSSVLRPPIPALPLIPKFQRAFPFSLLYSYMPSHGRKGRRNKDSRVCCCALTHQVERLLLVIGPVHGQVAVRHRAVLRLAHVHLRPREHRGTTGREGVTMW